MHSGLHIRFSPPWMVVVSQALSLSLLGFFS
ncbi:putative membrane protein, partial [Vibrio parahaemolyticus EKP-028]